MFIDGDTGNGIECDQGDVVWCLVDGVYVDALGEPVHQGAARRVRFR